MVNGKRLNGIKVGNTITFTIENVTEDKTVEILGVGNNMYEIIISEGEGYFVYAPKLMVEHGFSYEFSITLDSGYTRRDITLTINDITYNAVYVNGKIFRFQSDSGEYIAVNVQFGTIYKFTIFNITEDQYVTVGISDYDRPPTENPDISGIDAKWIGIIIALIVLLIGILIILWLLFRRRKENEEKPAKAAKA
jgi:hypothetical protein